MIGAIVGAGLGAVGSIFGGISASQAAKKRLEYLKQQEKENQSWYDRRYNEDATQRADAQRILTITQDAIRKRNRAIAGREAVQGGSTEQTAQEKERNNQMMSDAISQINAAGEKRKDQIEQQYRERKEAINDAKMAVEAKRSSAIGNAIQGVIGAGGSLASAFDK